jgi:hypothetical protein
MMMVIIAIIILFEWPKMKQYPKKDKQVFIMLLFIGLSLCLFDLPYISGPITWLETLFKPFADIMKVS